MTGVGIRWVDVSVDLDRHRILDAVDLTVDGGSWVTVVGPNGAGKTTLLRTLTGAVAHEGEVRLGSNGMSNATDRSRAAGLAVVPQHPVIPPGVRVFDYALLGRTPYQGLRFNASADDRRRTLAVLRRLDLGDVVERRLESLSGGERQRVVLARALAQDTPVLVLDEPTAFLDIGHQLEVLELIAELREERALTVVTTLHDLSIAGQFADVVAVLAKGHLVATGPPAEVLTPELIAEHWGVGADVTADPSGAVTISVRRRR